MRNRHGPGGHRTVLFDRVVAIGLDVEVIVEHIDRARYETEKQGQQPYEPDQVQVIQLERKKQRRQNEGILQVLMGPQKLDISADLHLGG